ncbi:MAG TPA: LuxR C-terminal-related transcriptional regulator, partial [Streptosporangiaceae bacterium]|nr:LuxR C-terminal-related transcriptional regulator [Streptosporangiaceae bacterium]
VRDPAQVAAVVATALGIRNMPSVAAADALAHALAGRQLLLVLDNCEHVIGAAAELCGRLLLGADDVRVLATSREPLRIAGEARYRLAPLTLADPEDLDAAKECEAVTLFADRARQADRGFALDETTGPIVAQLVTRLDGMPLAIELAAARADALGVAQLLDRIDDRFGLLADGDRLADERQRSLAAAVKWSYQLLDDAERRVFRAVSAFPGPFTLEGAEAVAGPDARKAVLRLVDCSLLVPPRVEPDGRSRYLMLETLRAYGAGLLAEAGEEGAVTAALAAYALKVAEEAALGLQTRTGEVAGLRHLDAEEVTLRHALAWAMERDPRMALRLALTQGPWWQLRGRLTAAAPLLAVAADCAQAGSEEWCAARMLLGQAADQAADPAGALRHFTVVRDTLEDTRQPVSPVRSLLLALCLSGLSGTLLYLGRGADAADEGRRSLALARETGLPGVEAVALASLSAAVWSEGDRDGALRLVHQAQQTPGEIPGALDRSLGVLVTMLLTEAGDLTAAEQAGTAGLARCREVGDVVDLCFQLRNMAVLDLRAGRVQQAAAHLHEQLVIAVRAGLRAGVLTGLDGCGYLCAATGREAEAVTVWAAMSALADPFPLPFESRYPGNRDEILRNAAALIGPDGARAAEERGTAMSLTTATEYALMLAASHAAPPGAGGAALATPDGPAATPTGLDKLSPRERELVTLVAQGRTDAQIAAQLYISVRTVSSHLDRIRDKTGCRRRADLTRLALSAGLV